MVSLHFVHHTFNISVGFIVNIGSLFVILRKTPSTLEEYSVLLLNTALVELISVINHFLVDGRIFLGSTAGLVISDGPCHYLSGRFCAFLTVFMNVVMIHSTALVALSFWYRVRILSGSQLLGKFRLQMIVFSLFLPHVAYIFGDVSMMSPRETLVEMVGQFHDAEGYGLYGFADVSQPLPALFLSYLIVYTIVMYSFIAWGRIRLMSVLRAKTAEMSVPTRINHESLAKILTIHASLPIVVWAILIAFAAAQYSGHHSEDIEGVLLNIALLPALVNPVLTLYYIPPYRLYITTLLCGPQRRVTLVHFADEGHLKLSINQKILK